MALPHAAAGEIIRIEPMGSTVIEETKTHALVKADRFEAARLVLPRGSAIAPHSVAGPITLYCVEGAITLEAGQTVQMRAGDWLYLEGGETHALSASGILHCS